VLIFFGMLTERLAHMLEANTKIFNQARVNSIKSWNSYRPKGKAKPAESASYLNEQRSCKPDRPKRAKKVAEDITVRIKKLKIFIKL